MKKIFILFAVVAVSFTACQKDAEIVSPDKTVSVDMTDWNAYTDEADLTKATHEHGRGCYSMHVLNEKLRNNPGLEETMRNIEILTREVTGKSTPDAARPTPVVDDPYEGPVTIPVIVNILEDYIGEVTEAQINSQIAVLTMDYTNLNPNTSGIPSEFAPVVADCGITFVLAGVNREISTLAEWGTNDAMKLSSQGGIDVTDPSTYLNLWVCDIGGGILGYAQFPGGAEATDGVVIGKDYFGVVGGVYGQGRTATHEVGHWLNLRHIWGDGKCNRDDYVTDTPVSDQPNWACPVYPLVHCVSNDMTMNYMDYVYDDCMYMFSEGQNARMRALFVPGGARESLVL
ncbi:MAG: zinc metalloprotease [Bacteroidales bacterium]|nr:zinc metalloprotease [Bacteroidales bacterium]